MPVTTGASGAAFFTSTTVTVDIGSSSVAVKVVRILGARVASITGGGTTARVLLPPLP